MREPIQIIVTTAPRLSAGDTYRAEALGQIRAQLGGAAELTVSDDPDRRGCVPALCAGLLKSLPGHRVLWLEDDIRLCKNAVKVMCSFEIPDDCAFVSFYDHYFNRERLPHPGLAGLFRFPLSSKLWGLQAVLFSVESMNVLRDWASMARENIETWKATFTDHSDHLVTTVLSAGSSKSQFAILYPNLVQHIGDVSTTVKRDGTPFDSSHLKSANYAGDGFDAMTLVG